MIWVPKTAGTSIYKALMPFGMVKVNHPILFNLFKKRKYAESPFITFGHYSLQSIISKKYITPESYERAFKFAFVRNPYDRFMSLYHYANNKKRPSDRPKYKTQEAFVERLKKSIDPIGFYNFKNLSNCNPQSMWLLNDKGRLAVDFVGRIENIETDFAKLANILGLSNYKLQHLNPENRCEKITQASRDFVEEFYRKDFEIFYNEL